MRRGMGRRDRDRRRPGSLWGGRRPVARLEFAPAPRASGRRVAVLSRSLRRGCGARNRVQRPHAPLVGHSRNRGPRACLGRAVTEPPLIRRLEDETALREAEAGGPLVPPPNLGRRVRARQALIVLVAAAVMIAVVGATIVAVSGAIRRQAPSAEPTMTGPEGHRTAYVDGVRLSYPRRWSLLQLPGAGNPAPLLQLTNFRPHSAAGLGCGGGGTSIPARGVLLVVGQVRPPLAGLPRWPVSMVPRGRGCFAARWSVRGVAMEAFMIVGSRARLLARRDMLESFHSMRFPAELRPGLTSPREVAGGAGPMFVVASGYLAGRPSSYLARATDGGVCLANVVGSGPATGPCPAIQAAGS